MRYISSAMLTAIGVLTANPVFAQTSDRSQSQANEVNSGQDPTRPVTRLDVRFKHQNGVNGKEVQFLTLRVDKPFVLKDNWQLATRVDLPLLRTTVNAQDGSVVGHEGGLGDMLVQGLLISPSTGKATFAVGTQLILPTGNDEQLTAGKWQLSPTLAAVYQIPELSKGSFVAIVARNTFSIAGEHEKPDINVVSLQPIFNWQHKDGWFATTSPEIKFNVNDDWSAFVPVDLTIGKVIGQRAVVSLQGSVAAVSEYDQYDWLLEARAGFFF